MQILEDSALTNLKHVNSIAYKSVLTLITDTSLTPESRELLNTTLMCILQTNRIINLSDFLAHSDQAALQSHFQNFAIKNLVEEISSTFYNTLSSYVPIDIKTSIDLDDTTYILLDQSRFELAVLNLLYCSLKNHDTRKPTPIKLNISVTETRNCVVFHIKDNNKACEPQKQPSSFCISRPNAALFDGLSTSSLLSMSLRAAQLFTEQMGGSITHTPLKSGNRYDISLPKHRKDIIHMQSISKYKPTKSYFTETFSEFLLQTCLNNVVNMFDELNNIMK